MRYFFLSLSPLTVLYASLHTSIFCELARSLPYVAVAADKIAVLLKWMILGYETTMLQPLKAVDSYVFSV